MDENAQLSGRPDDAGEQRPWTPLTPGVVSIGMSAFNNSSTIRLAISSVLAQTDPAFELLVFDACSMDDTYSLACDVACGDPRVTVERLAHQRGWYDNARAHLDRARGEFFMWLDADDHLAPDVLVSLKAALTDPGVDGAHGTYVFVEKGGRVVSNVLGHAQPMTFTGSPLAFWRRARYTAFPESAAKCNLLYAMWRTDSLRSLDPWNAGERGMDDDVFFVARSLGSVAVRSVPDAITFRRTSAPADADADFWPDWTHRQEGTPDRPQSLAHPSTWHVYKIPKGYSRRYLQGTGWRQGLAVLGALGFRFCVSLAGRVIRRLGAR